jgi:hypothetical protein
VINVLKDDIWDVLCHHWRNLVGLGMWCSIEDVLCHLLYVCVNSDSCKHWHWYGNAQHFFRVLLYLGGYSLVTIGKLKEVSLEQILVWMWYKLLSGVTQCNFLDLMPQMILEKLCLRCVKSFNVVSISSIDLTQCSH